MYLSLSFTLYENIEFERILHRIWHFKCGTLIKIFFKVLIPGKNVTSGGCKISSHL